MGAEREEGSQNNWCPGRQGSRPAPEGGRTHVDGKVEFSGNSGRWVCSRRGGGSGDMRMDNSLRNLMERKERECQLEKGVGGRAG